MTRKMNPTSRVSLMALRNRTTDSAPTRANARAMFDPTTSMIRAMSMPRMTSVCTYDWL
jgi:hypothetical protein